MATRSLRSVGGSSQKDSLSSRQDGLRESETEKNRGGFFAAEPVRVSGSGILSSMIKSDGFVVVEDEKEGIAKGERVLVCLHSF